MKNAVLLLMLLPFIGFSQNLATWNSSSPTTSNSNITAQSIQLGGGVTIENNGWSGFRINNQGYGASGNAGISYSKYLEFRVTPNTGYNMVPGAFNFIYSTSGDSPTKLQVRYSTSSSFTNNGTLLGTVQTLASGQNSLSLSFPSGYTVPSGTTLYIRVYGYRESGDWYYSDFYVRNTVYNAATSGPTLTGTTPTSAGVLANNDTASTFAGQPVTINVTSNDTATGTTISSVAVQTQPSHGTAAVSNGQIVYTPANNTWSGQDTFTYKITGASGATSTATVTVTVNPLVAPTVGNDSASTYQNNAVSVNVLSNDTSGSGAFSSIAIFTNPSHGTAVVQANNTILYTPATGYTGSDSFVYRYTNAYGSTANGTVSISVNPIIQPVAANDNVTLVRNSNVAINVLSNDTPGSGTVTSVAVLSNPSNGTAVVQSNNTILYTPASNYTGSDSFTYRYTDSFNNTASATVNISVTFPPVGTSPLNGTYVISRTTQNAYPQFSTITAAVSHLNSYGISGAVTFLLKDTSYTNTNESFPLTVNPIANSSATNTITFKPYTGVNVNITASNVNNYTGIPAIFYLNGSDYLVFDGSNTTNGTTRNLTLNNTDYIDYIQRSVFWIASNGSNGATNITVKNCNIKQAIKNQGGKFCVGVYSGNNGIGDNNTMTVGAATANNSNLLITNNDFMNVKQGVYFNGGSTLTTNVTVTKNDLGAVDNNETIISPATFSNVNGFEYSDNLVNNLYRNTDDGNLVSAGVYITGATKNGSILRNNMRDLTRTQTNNQIFAGIALSSTETNANILVANNFILNVTGHGSGGGYLNGYGIIADNGGGYKIYHNTVSLNTNQPEGGFSAAFYVTANARALDVRNNIFANNQTNTATRRSAIMVVAQVSNINTIFTYLDYNDYYSNDRLGYVANVNSVEQANWPGNGVQGNSGDNADYTYTLQAWKSVTGKDAHSVNVSPVFVSVSDLHINAYSAVNAGINNLGTPLTAVVKDIDGQLRSTTTPDMGADEFGALSMPTAGSPTGIYCDSATTWNGTTWSNGLPTADKDVIFNGNYTQTGNTFYACSIFVLNGASVNFISNSNAIVTHSVNVADTGALTFESSSNLIQLENDANSGIATVKRNSGRLKRLDYTMWTAPVLDSRTTGYQSLLSFSPATTASRFYEYSTSGDEYRILPAETTKFAKGKGYLVRMPNGDPTPGYNAGTTRIIFPAAFIGTINNGNIRVPLSFEGTGYNAVGNPYPSPINVQDFITENINNIEGTIWIWRKTNDHTVSSYSTVNLTGYVANNALGGGGTSGADGNDLIADPYAIDPKGCLNTAQGFIVKAKSANKDLVFRNNMRLQTHSNTFFRTAAPQETEQAAQTNRLWINVTNAGGEFSQTLIGYNEVSSLNYDSGYDGEALINGNLNLYSLLQTETDTLSLTIQARGTFAQADRVKLGLNATLAGTYVISKDHADGLFEEGQTVYLIDNLTGEFHNLTESNYTFTTEAGTFNERFVVAYATDEQLGTDTPVVTQPKATVVFKDGKRIAVNAPSEINTVTVYDMLGKTIFQKSNVDTTEFATTDINVAPQVLIVKITLKNQQVVSKKIMMN